MLGSRLAALHRGPYARRRRRHIDVVDPDRAQRIHDRIHHRRWRPDRPRLAYAFDAQRVGAAGHVAEVSRYITHVVGARHAVVHIGAGEELSAGAVIDHVLHQRLPDSLRDPALDLTLADHGVDRAAAVIDHAVTIDGDAAGRRIELDLAHMATVRITR